jgi:glycosyltransferase involved in cell wall biosynthesis
MADAQAAAAKPLKILHVFRAPLGGLFRHVIDLAKGQIAAGHQVGIFCDATTGGKRADEVFAELGTQLALGVTRMPMSRYPSYLDSKAQLGFIAARQRLQPDVVHCHGSKGGVYGRLPALLGTKRDYITAYTPHGGSFNYKPGGIEHRIYMGVERLLERATDMFLFESVYIRDRFVAYVGHMPVTDHRVVVNGVSKAEFEPIDHSNATFDLVYLGELRTAKGVDTLIEALAILKNQHKQTPRILVVGSGPEADALKDMARQMGVFDQAVFASPGPIRAALAQARIMVIPSRAESLPYVILEAAAAAQPLVSTDVGGIPEIYGPDHIGRLIPPNDSRKLADAIRAALALAPQALDNQAKDLANYVSRHFLVDDMIANVTTAYGEALATRRGGHE